MVQAQQPEPRIDDASTVNAQKNLGYLVNDVARMLAVIYTRRMEAMQLTRAQWRVIGYVAARAGVYQGELADLVGVGRMSISGVLDRMESKGLVERQADPSDRRLKRVFLTTETQALIPDLQRVADELMGQVQKDLSARERQTLLKLLLRVQANAVSLIESDARSTG